MKKYDGYDQAQAFSGEYEKLEPGGYVCRIIKVTAEEKAYGTLLRIGFDIVEGDHAGYYKRTYDRKAKDNAAAKWPGMYYQTIKADDLKYFKGFMTAIEESNPGYKWNWDENTLKGKLFGGIFGEEEYEGNDGKVHTSVKCQWVRSIETVRSGKFEIPEPKKLQQKPSTNSTQDEVYPGFADSSDSDLPF